MTRKKDKNTDIKKALWEGGTTQWNLTASRIRLAYVLASQIEAKTNKPLSKEDRGYFEVMARDAIAYFKNKDAWGTIPQDVQAKAEEFLRGKYTEKFRRDKARRYLYRLALLGDKKKALHFSRALGISLPKEKKDLLIGADFDTVMLQYFVRRREATKQ